LKNKNTEPKIYLQPLGFLKGCSDSDVNFKNLVGGGIYFSAVKCIIRDADNTLAEQIIPINLLHQFIESLSKTIADEAASILKNLTDSRLPIRFNNHNILNEKKPIIQGILNITPDSFSDGGQFDTFEKSIEQAGKMIAAGARIIDIGGESTRPNAIPISIEEELSRVLPVVERLATKNILISIDSRNASVMKAAVEKGAHIVNDVSALGHDPQSMATIKNMNVPVVLMHSQGDPKVMQINPHYDHVILDVYDYLAVRVQECLKAGITKNNIIIDPGIGFGKTVKDNLNILKNMSIFHGLGVPVLVGVSRKSFIGKLVDETDAQKRLPGSLASAQICYDQAIQIIRVHDVNETDQAMKIWHAIGSEN
jgi:dihydropteroate synthase